MMLTRDGVSRVMKCFGVMRKNDDVSPLFTRRLKIIPRAQIKVTFKDENPYHQIKLMVIIKRHPAKGVRDASTSLSHPPGFTTKTSVTHANVGEICEDGPTNGEDMVNMPRVDAKVMDHSQEDDMVRVGHSMGYNLDGCLKDMERIIG
ncbi:hypothetical protein Tco_0283474, partial [Tanacetum coccineum]